MFDCFSLYEGAVIVNISCDMSKLLFSTSKTYPKQNMVYLNQKPESYLKREEGSRDEISLKRKCAETANHTGSSAAW